MMLAYKLVRLIESHSDALAARLLERVQDCPFLVDFRRAVPPEELTQRAYEIYHHLGDWLLGKSVHDIDVLYRHIGARRAAQRVPLSQFIWAIILTKETLWAFISDEVFVDRPVELFGELEILRLLGQFFDHALYYGAVGYEQALATEEIAETSTAW